MIEAARLEWAADGTPISSSDDDVYHFTESGLEQRRHVFIAGNALPQRWQDRSHFCILETGFGPGLNFLATWQAWRNDPARCERLHFISTELHPFERDDLARLHARWPELADMATQLQEAWPPLTPGFHHLLLDGGRVMLTLLFGDANSTLPQLLGSADAFYLDGFAPQKNPRLWSRDLLQTLSQHAAPDSTLASWCVAGEVCAALRELGWTLHKRPGYVHKWQMLTARRDEAAAGESPCSAATPPTDAIIIGAGIAGCSMAEALARRGWQVTLLERNAAATQAASGNPAGLLHPMLAKDDNLAARFSRAAYLYSLRLLTRLDPKAGFWQGSGMLQLAEDAADADKLRTSCSTLPADYAVWVEQAEANRRAGLPVAAGGVWFPHGAWVKPPALCMALLQAAGTRAQTRYGCTVHALRNQDDSWQALDSDGRVLASARHLILANAAAANTLLPELALTLRGIRGQLSYLPDAALAGLNTALCGAGYAIRNGGEQAIIGASFIEDDTDTVLRATEHADNLRKLRQLLPGFAHQPDPATLPGRVSFRAASQDRLPLVGTLPRVQLREQHTLANLPRQAGLHILAGLGARGLSWAPLAAELLAAQLGSESLPLEQSLVRALDPARFHLRTIRRNANR